MATRPARRRELTKLKSNDFGAALIHRIRRPP